MDVSDLVVVTSAAAATAVVLHFLLVATRPLVGIGVGLLTVGIGVLIARLL